MTTRNPYASPSLIQDRFAPICIEWESRRIEVSGAVVGDGLRTLPKTAYTILIDGNESFSNTQITGTEEFDWQFEHDGRTAEATFEPIKWQRWGELRFRLCIDGNEVACETISVRGFGYSCTFYMFFLIGMVVILPGALVMLVLLVIYIVTQ